MASNKPVIHGREHAPRSADPSYTERWHYVGASGEPAFQNSWVNVGTPYPNLRFRLIVGPPRTTELNKAVELQGTVNGGVMGSVVFTLPAAYRPDFEIPPHPIFDGGFRIRALRVLANGDVIIDNSATSI